MESAVVAAITTLLTVVQTVLPLVSGTAASTGTIGTVVVALEKWVPLVIALFPSATTLFQSIRNIIASLSSNPDTPAAQLATLQQLDAQVDAAFEAIAAQTDPDLPGGDLLAPKV